jgi:eukaryotic-like serine/threonine-protein kinase
MSVVQPGAGLVIGSKYRLLERIGVGGMSEVYRAENLLIGRVVALKLLHREQAGDPKLTVRFFQEAQSVSRIRHPSIVDVLDAGMGETGPFIVMEYLEGESAAHVLARSGRVPLEAAIATLLPVLDALEAAHHAGVIHRDLKPENVFYALGERGEVEVKLLDFGIAKMLWPVGPTPRTSTGVVFGTPDYLSPEQAVGETVIDGRSDVFSAGVVLYELVTNVRPFHAPTAVATAYKVAHARVEPVVDHGGPANPGLDAILARALQKRPDERYSSAREFAAELRSLARGLELTQALRGLVRTPRRHDARAPSASPASAVLTATPSPSPRLGTPLPSLLDSSRGAAVRAERTPSSGARRTAIFGSQPPQASDSGSGPTLRSAREPSRGVRFMPARFAGQCHARGLLLAAIDGHVARGFPEQRDQILDTLDEQHASEFRFGTLQAIVHYDLEAVTAYLERATARLYADDPSWCRAAGAAAVGTELAAVLRPALRPARPIGALRRLIPIVSRFFDFGRWETHAERENLVCVRVADFDPASLCLRLFVVGVIESSLSACGTGADVVIARGEAAFSPHLVLDVSGA